jgi:hypothetical protein
MAEKKVFLVAYDYGGGGLWGAMMASDEGAIRERFPELTIVSERPSWMSDERYQQILDTECHDVDGAIWGILNALISDRASRA